jgi:hypothetical protein
MIDELGIKINQSYLLSKGFDEVDGEYWNITLCVRLIGNGIFVFIGQDRGFRTYFEIQYQHEMDTLLKFLNY